MGVPYSEWGDYLEAYQYGGSYTTPGNTISEDFNVIPGDAVIHCGLARVAAAEAIIGIAEVSHAHDGTRNFGIPETWETAAYGQISAFTIGVYVARGVMKGWFFVQSCR